MNKLVILSKEEINDHYDPNKAGNGGGYHQPGYLFRYGSWDGYFRNTSCGGFGTRYHLEIADSKHTFSAAWGSMRDCSSSNFPDTFPDEEFYKDFQDFFGKKIPTEYNAMQEYCRSFGYSLEEYLAAGHPNLTAWNNDRLRRERALKEEYNMTS